MCRQEFYIITKYDYYVLDKVCIKPKCVDKITVVNPRTHEEGFYLPQIAALLMKLKFYTCSLIYNTGGGKIKSRELKKGITTMLSVGITEEYIGG